MQWRAATVSNVMTSDVFAVGRDTSLETAARLLTTHHISGAPVVSEGGRPVGVISLADLLDPDAERSETEGYPMFYRVTGGMSVPVGDASSVAGGQVADVMRPFVLAIEPTASLSAAARMMVAENVHRLLVMERGTLIGIVSSLDLLRGMVGVAVTTAVDASPDNPSIADLPEASTQ